MSGEPSMDDPYAKGQKFVNSAIDKFLTKGVEGWRSLGIFTHDPGPLIDTRKVFISPDMFLKSITKHTIKNNHQTLLILDASPTHSYSPSTPVGKAKIDYFLEELDSLPSSLLYFGKKPEGNPVFDNLESIKVDLDWVLNRKVFTAKVVKAASIVDRSIKGKDLANVFDLGALGKFLIQSLGPPSFSEEAVQAAKGAGADQIASDVTSSISSPYSALYKGIKYAYKFAKLRQKRKKEEVQQEYKEWEEMVEQNFSQENLGDLVTEKGLNHLLNQLSINKFVLILNGTHGTPYELFFPLFLRNLYEQWRAQTPDEHLYMCVDNAAEYLKDKTTTDLLRPPHQSLKNVHFVSHLYTKDPLNEALLTPTAKDYLRERAIIIDMTPKLFDAVFKDLKLSTRSYLQKQFETIGKKNLKDDLYYLSYNRAKKVPWQLNNLQMGMTGKLYSSLRKAVTQIVDTISSSIDSKDLDIPDHDLSNLLEEEKVELAARHEELEAEKEAEIEEEKKIK
ncbi:MAG: hypothetical protein ACW976_04710 [Candidatus Ranarchaeia archaeon]|jgi:hypothetical protein